MSCDIARIFGTFTERLPADPNGHAEFLFVKDVLPVAPGELACHEIIIQRTVHYYDDFFRADALSMYVTQSKCREIGLLLLSCAFDQREDETTVLLTNPRSDIKKIEIPPGRPRQKDASYGLTVVPYLFRYYPAETKKFPFEALCSTHDLPILALTASNPASLNTKEDWDARDTLRVTGSIEARVRFAEFLLNAGCPGNPVREYSLEGEAGFRSVGPMSAELCIFLPGSDWWIAGGHHLEGDGDTAD